MASFNSCTFTGRAGNDPETRYLDNGNAVTQFNLAVDQYTKKGEDPKTLWITVSVWGKRGETITNYVKKGSQILVSGELALDQWEKDGKTITKPKLNCREFTFIGGGKREDGGGGAGRATARPSSQSRNQPAPDDDDIPF